MYLRNFLKFSSAFALMVTIMFAANYDIFAQKEHGNGHSKDRGDRSEGDDHGNGKKGKWNGDSRQERGDQGLNRQHEWNEGQSHRPGSE